MPAVRGDGMRGLAVFISDIRNCEFYDQYIYCRAPKVHLIQKNNGDELSLLLICFARECN